MGAWIAAAAATGLWLLLLLALAVATRNPDVEPGPATGELAGQPPAVVDLITGDWRLCDEAPSATLLDLAARGVVAVEEIGPELSLVRLRGEPGDLRPYERLVYDHVRSLAVDGVVATGALAEGSRDLGRWWKSFRKKVIVEARAQGLSRPRWSRAHALLLGVAAAVPAAAIGIAVAADDARANHDGGPGAAIVSFALLVTLMGRLNGERGTAEGARAAAHWLGVREHLRATGRFAEQPAASVTIWGRHLAYAAALGLAPRAVRSLPVSTPADDNRAWSDYGGMWHVVNVRYPSRLLWGRPPGATILRGLAAGWFTGFPTWIILVVAAAFGVWPDGLVLPAALAVGLAVAGLPVVRAISDLGGAATVEGQVVRLRRFPGRRQGERHLQVDVLVRDRRRGLPRGQGHVPERGDVASPAGGRQGAGRGRAQARLDQAGRRDRGLAPAGRRHLRRHRRIRGGRAGEPRRGARPARPPAGRVGWPGGRPSPP